MSFIILFCFAEYYEEKMEKKVENNKK